VEIATCPETGLGVAGAPATGPRVAASTAGPQAPVAATSGQVSALLGAGYDPEQRTRARVCREVLARGPVTAAELGALLGLTPAAVRRHLDVLLADEFVTVWEAPDRSRGRGRGRPARRFVVTDAGHAALTSAYDDLAASALRYLTRLAGDGAVRRFADERVAELEQRYRPVVDSAGSPPGRRAQALAVALSGDGYAASTRTLEIAGTQIGTQLCQGHCPVQHVAREFPQICEAETEAFSRLLGVHVQRLATLAHGEHVCTTHVPNAATSPDHLPGRAAGTTGGSTLPGTSTHEHPDHAQQVPCCGDEEMTP
jgi:predicted ArsR family transcriptional regulator